MDVDVSLAVPPTPRKETDLVIVLAWVGYSACLLQREVLDLGLPLPSSLWSSNSLVGGGQKRTADPLQPVSRGGLWLWGLLWPSVPRC